eukprot:1383346-Rhodomonas_salina.8
MSQRPTTVKPHWQPSLAGARPEIARPEDLLTGAFHPKIAREHFTLKNQRQITPQSPKCNVAFIQDLKDASQSALFQPKANRQPEASRS